MLVLSLHGSLEGPLLFAPVGHPKVWLRHADKTFQTAVEHIQSSES